MLRILLCFALPFQALRIQDVEFNHYLNDVLVSVGAIGYFLPKYFKQEKICKIDDDCPDIMRCCEIGQKKYCCSPNNFVKMNLAFPNKEVSL